MAVTFAFGGDFLAMTSDSDFNSYFRQWLSLLPRVTFWQWISGSDLLLPAMTFWCDFLAVTSDKDFNSCFWWWLFGGKSFLLLMVTFWWWLSGGEFPAVTPGMTLILSSGVGFQAVTFLLPVVTFWCDFLAVTPGGDFNSYFSGDFLACSDCLASCCIHECVYCWMLALPFYSCLFLCIVK